MLDVIAIFALSREIEREQNFLVSDYRFKWDNVYKSVMQDCVVTHICFLEDAFLEPVLDCWGRDNYDF